jgi:hypothetical protein
MAVGVSWWLRTKAGHMIMATTCFAVPVITFFALQMRDRGVLSFRNFLYLVCVAIVFGMLAAKSMWDVWLKKKLQK